MASRCLTPRNRKRNFRKIMSPNIEDREENLMFPAIMIRKQNEYYSTFCCSISGTRSVYFPVLDTIKQFTISSSFSCRALESTWKFINHTFKSKIINIHLYNTKLIYLPDCLYILLRILNNNSIFIFNKVSDTT